MILSRSIQRGECKVKDVLEFLEDEMDSYESDDSDRCWQICHHYSHLHSLSSLSRLLLSLSLVTIILISITVISVSRAIISVIRLTNVIYVRNNTAKSPASLEIELKL